MSVGKSTFTRVSIPKGKKWKKIGAIVFLPPYDPHKWIPKIIFILTTRRPLSGLLFWTSFIICCKVNNKCCSKKKSRERSSSGQNQNSFWNPFMGVIGVQKNYHSYFFFFHFWPLSVDTLSFTLSITLHYRPTSTSQVFASNSVTHRYILPR